LSETLANIPTAAGELRSHSMNVTEQTLPANDRGVMIDNTDCVDTWLLSTFT
jgi:hypothetical protein